VYLAAFTSLAGQIRGLMGSQGIVPVERVLQILTEKNGGPAYWGLPSLLWWWHTDAALTAICWAGAALSVVLLLDRAVAPVLALLWGLYLSLVSVGFPFLHYQWDMLLLETGFLAIVLGMAAPSGGRFVPPRLLSWTFRLLLFRLMFASGVVKWQSQDPTWRSLTALQYHYETQPLPTWIAWYLNQLPEWAQKASCAVTFIVEWALPWALFLGRRARQVAVAGFAALQVLILLSGNYGFFNYLTLALCLWGLDDEALPVAVRRLAARLGRVALPIAGLLRASAGIAAVLATAGLLSLAGQLGRFDLPTPLSGLVEITERWNLVNGYGLFAVMTTERDEIEIEGSRDGQQWVAYPFRWKPQGLDRRPAFVAPHMPRLDWQMWFAALSPRSAAFWFSELVARLRDGSPDVLTLFAANPFPGTPPQFLRARWYRYHFTRRGDRPARDWWTREPLGDFPP
jgi:hypothetical protein